MLIWNNIILFSSHWSVLKESPIASFLGGGKRCIGYGKSHSSMSLYVWFLRLPIQIRTLIIKPRIIFITWSILHIMCYTYYQCHKTVNLTTLTLGYCVFGVYASTTLSSILKFIVHLTYREHYKGIKWSDTWWQLSQVNHVNCVKWLPNKIFLLDSISFHNI